MELVFLEIAEIQKEEIFKVNDEEFQVRYECWLELEWSNCPIKNRNHQH